MAISNYQLLTLPPWFVSHEPPKSKTFSQINFKYVVRETRTTAMKQFEPIAIDVILPDVGQKIKKTNL
jgi:hypothetical protein